MTTTHLRTYVIPHSAHPRPVPNREAAIREAAKTVALALDAHYNDARDEDGPE